MTRLSTREIERVREASDALSTLASGDPPALTWLVAQLPALLDADVGGAYGVSVDEERVRLDWLHLDQAPPAFGEEFGRFLAGGPVRFGYYDPLLPEDAQRNRALRLCDIEQIEQKPRPALFTTFLGRHGLARADQLRVLICDGPVLLGWVGAFREPAFGLRERALLQQLQPALQKRLVLERQLSSASFASAAMTTALEALPAAAYIVTQKGSVAHANALGRALLQTDRAATQTALVDSLRGQLLDAPFSLTRFAAQGLPDHYLAVRRSATLDAAPRVLAASRRWELTARQAEVLSLLASGLANKTIAARLHCAERTVELHVSAILSKAGAGSRSALVARLWTES